MKINKKATIAAALFSAAMTFNACDNQNRSVYGPPPDMERFDYEQNQNAGVYGPPPENWDEDESTDDDIILQDEAENSSQNENFESNSTEEAPENE